MKILVMGANGYLGSSIVKALVEKDAEVIATDFAVDRIDERVPTITGNILTIEDPYTFFGQPDALLHLAWRDGFVHYSNAHI